MQKKIIALAVAGLASTAAFAQSNVTIYGSIDYGYSYRTDARKPAGTNRGIADSASSFDGGQTQGNRLGFKGTEDLGNGLKAVFLMEQGFNGDTGAGGQGGLFYGRQAYVGLAGKFGTVIGGRLYTPHHSFISSIDPFSSGTVGQYKNVVGSDVNALFDPTRVDNAIAYVSPSFGGAKLTAAYSNNFSGQESALDNARNNTVYALLGQYEGGPVSVGLSYHYIAPQSTGANSTVDNVQDITLGGTFDAKVVKIHALYAWKNLDFQTAGASDVTLQNYLIGASVPVGKATIKASYVLSDGNRAAGGNAQQFALGANYALSKRTDLYSALSIIDNDKSSAASRLAGTGDATNSGLAATGVPYQQGFQMGVRHLF